MLRSGPLHATQWVHFALGDSHESACFNLVDKMRKNGSLV